MKLLLTLFLSVCIAHTYAQSADQCGKDDHPLLNTSEAVFLNEYLKGKTNSFDFSGKKIFFITGNIGSKAGTKSAYFSNIRKWQEIDQKIATTLIAFTPEQKQESGGYDGVLTYWCKTVPSTVRIIQRIKKAE
jgi:hypothetical protein